MSLLNQHKLNAKFQIKPNHNSYLASRAFYGDISVEGSRLSMALHQLAILLW